MDENFSGDSSGSFSAHQKIENEAARNPGDCLARGHRPVVIYHPTSGSGYATSGSGHATSGSGHATVATTCSCARKQGVLRGSALPLALALLPSATRTFPLRAEKDFALLCRLARWALKFSPLIAIDRELLEAAKEGTLSKVSPLHYGFYIDLTGTERVHGGEEVILDRIERALRSRGLSYSLAITPTPGASWALSRCSGSSRTVIEDTSDISERLKDILGSLPIESFRLDDETLQSLHLLGVSRVHELLKLPFKKLGTRFPQAQGPTGLLTRIRQALGTQNEVLSFIHPPTIIRESRRFEVPLMSHASIEHVLLELLHKIFEKLLRDGKTTRSLIIEIASLDINRRPTITRKELALCHATRDVKHARSVIAPLIESIHSAEGVAALTLTARLTSRSKPLQHQLLKEQGSEKGSFQHDSESVQELMNHLLSRLGSDRVMRIEPLASYLPEQSFQYQSIGSSLTTNRETTRGGVAHGKRNLHEAGLREATEGPFMKRPSYLFEIPEPITAIAMLPDKPPSQLTWNRERLKVTMAEGPERICLEWWQHSLATSQVTTHGNHASRDYFRLQDQTGRWLWVFRDNSSESWFVHGMWV